MNDSTGTSTRRWYGPETYISWTCQKCYHSNYSRIDDGTGGFICSSCGEFTAYPPAITPDLRFGEAELQAVADKVREIMRREDMLDPPVNRDPLIERVVEGLSNFSVPTPIKSVRELVKEAAETAKEKGFTMMMPLSIHLKEVEQDYICLG